MKKKSLQKVFLVILLVMITIWSLQLNVKAANFSISSSASKVEVGKTFTITINGTGLAGKFVVSGSGGVNCSTSVWVDNEKVTVTGTATGVGKATITVKGEYAMYSDGVDKTETVSTSITVVESSTGDPGTQDPPTSTGGSTPTTPSTAKSTNNYLSSLSVDVGTLSPAFSKSVADYVVDVPEDTEKIKISAKKEDSKATVSGTGEKVLEVGQNTFRITVKSEDGKSRIYNIVVNKGEKPQEEQKILLSTLTIKGVTVEGMNQDVVFTPEFSAEVYEYSCEIGEDIDSLTINALSDIEDAIIEINGNENLIPGENIIEIKITSADGTKESIYKITANKAGQAIVETISTGIEEEKTFFDKVLGYYDEIMFAVFVLACICAVLGTIFAIIEYVYSKNHPEEYAAKKQAKADKKKRKKESKNKNFDDDDLDDEYDSNNSDSKKDIDDDKENINDLFKIKDETPKKRKSKGKHS